MALPDIAYLAVIAAGLLLDHRLLWPRFQRRVRVAPGPARRGLWLGWITLLWGLTAIGMTLWLFEGRAWTDLRLGLPFGWQLGLGIGVVAATAAMQAMAVMKIARLPADRPVRFGSRQNEMSPMLPHTRREFGGFIVLSLSAGFCEEFIFRGYLIWVLQGPLGLWPAAVLSVLAFAFAHAYQGLHGVLGTGVVGALLTLLVLLTGSLWPAIVVHALLDMGQGWIAWLVLRRQPGATAGDASD